MPSQRVQLLPISDFTGGLNLRGDAFEVADNELIDALNVDISPQGGVRRRKTLNALDPSSGSMGADLLNIWQFFGGGVEQILVYENASPNDKLWYSSNEMSSASSASFSGTGGGSGNFPPNAATMSRVTSANSDRLYIVRNTNSVVASAKWDGSSIAALTNAHGAYNDNLAAPAGGKFPIANFVCTHMGFMFVASTNQSGTNYPSRIRWSHPGEPEDWRTNDYIDVDPGADGDFITGLASYQDRLFIFKNRSVHMLTGYDADTFEVRQIADVGAPTQQAISVDTTYGVAFFDTSRGVHLISGSDIRPLWENLRAVLSDGSLDDDWVFSTNVGWMDSRLYVSVGWGSNLTSLSRVFVYDPLVGKHGAWWAYDWGAEPNRYGFGPTLDFRPSAAGNSTRKKFAIAPYGLQVLQIDIDRDTDVSDGVDVDFQSYVTTSFFSAGAPGVTKRWRRPTFVISADNDIQLGVTAYRDFSMLGGARNFSLSSNAATSGGLVWGTDDWGDSWGEAPVGEKFVARGSGLGRAYAVALKVQGPLDEDWGLSEIEFRYIPQRIR